MIQWLAHKDFTCFIPEWIKIFLTNIFKSLVVTCRRYDVILFVAWSHFQKGFLYFDRYCRQQCLCPNYKLLFQYFCDYLNVCNAKIMIQKTCKENICPPWVSNRANTDLNM